MKLISKNSVFDVTTTSLRCSPEMTFDQWQRKMEEFRQFINIWDKNFRWWLGDCIIEGERRFPDKYSQALDKCMYSKQYLRNVVYVCRNVPHENRVSSEVVSFEHHYTVAKLRTEDQRAWLEKAENESWTTRQLRCAIQGQRIATHAVPHRLSPMRPDSVRDINFDVWWENAGKKIHPELEEAKCREIAEAAWDAKQA